MLLLLLLRVGNESRSKASSCVTMTTTTRLTGSHTLAHQLLNHIQHTLK